MKENLPNLSFDIPDYPDWKKGVKWGIIWGIGWATVVLFLDLTIAEKIRLVEGREPTFAEDLFLKIGVFIAVFVTITIATAR